MQNEKNNCKKLYMLKHKEFIKPYNIHKYDIKEEHLLQLIKKSGIYLKKDNFYILDKILKQEYFKFKN